MRAESSERGFRKLRQDKVGGWLTKCNLHHGNQQASTFARCVCVSSVRLWPLPVWRWSQERNLARVWKNPGLLHAAKWSKMKSCSLGWRDVSVTYHLLKWFPCSSGTLVVHACLLAEGDCSLPSRTISFVLPVLFPQDVLEYKKKQRPQKIKMLDGAVKTIMVDDSKTVGELLVTICSRIGNWKSPSPANMNLIKPSSEAWIIQPFF